MTSRRTLRGRVTPVPHRAPMHRDVVKVLPATHCQQATPVRLPKLEGNQPEIARRAGGVHVVVLLDCSGSEYMANGDREGFRMACIRSLVRLMKLTGGGTVTVIHWGSRPVHAYGPAPVLSEFELIDAALQRDPGSMGGNNFPAALQLARTDVDRVEAETTLVIGVTDGLEPITPAMAGAIGVLPEKCVHMMLVPGGNCPEALADEWQALPLGSFTRLPSDNKEMAKTVGRIYAAAVGGVLPDVPLREIAVKPPRTRKRLLRRRIAA